jgi:hypothetical protein
MELFRSNPTQAECEDALDFKNMSQKAAKIDTQQIV